MREQHPQRRGAGRPAVAHLPPSMCLPCATPSNGDGGDGGTMAKKDAASKRLGADTRSQHAVNMARSTTRKRKRPRTSSYRLPELVRPDGAGYMALYCAAHWIATRGGTLEINPLDEGPWREAFKDLLDQIASEDVKVFGVRDGTKPEHISGIHFASCLVDYPFSERLGLIREELCLVSRPYIDDEHWRGVLTIPWKTGVACGGGA